MPTNVLVTANTVRVAESVEDKIYNFRPTDTPLVSAIGRRPIENTFHEWTSDVYRTPNAANKAAEGADVTYSAQAQPTQYNNRTQIIQDTMSVSNTAEKVRKFGRKSEIARLKTKKMVELKRDIEAACIANGTAIAGNASTAGQLRGLYGWIATSDSLGASGVSPDPTTNTAPTAGTLRALTSTLVDAVTLAAYQQGGDAEMWLVSPTHKQKFSTFTGNVQRTNEVTGSRDATLQTAFTFYGHDFGVTKVVPNRVMAGLGAAGDNTAYLVDSDKLFLGQLRAFESEQMAIVGDATNWQIRTEVTLIVAQESTLGAIRDLTTSGS